MASANPTLPRNPLSGVTNQLDNLRSAANIQSARGLAGTGRLFNQVVKTGLNTALSAAGSPVLAKAVNIVAANKYLRRAAIATQAVVWTFTTLLPMIIILSLIGLIVFAVYQAVDLLKNDHIRFVALYGEELAGTVVDVLDEGGLINCAWESGKTAVQDIKNTKDKAKFILTYYAEEGVGEVLDFAGVADSDDAHIITGSDMGREYAASLQAGDPGGAAAIQAACLSELNTSVIVSRLIEAQVFLINPQPAK